MMKADHCRHMFSNLVVFKKVGNVGGKDAQLISIHLLNPCSFQISRLAQIRTNKFRQASYIRSYRHRIVHILTNVSNRL